MKVGVPGPTEPTIVYKAWSSCRLARCPRPCTWRVVPGIVHVVVHTREDPSDGDWDEYVDDLERNANNIRGLLVYTEAAGPSAEQRKKAVAMWERMGIQRQTAVMTGSRVTRGIVTAMSWVMGSAIRAYHVNDFAGAVKSLGLSDDESAAVSQTLRELGRDAGINIGNTDA